MERNHMMVKDENYQGHPVFSDLVRYEAFYKSLASSVFQWVSLGTRSLGNIDSYVFSSIEGTLASIQTVLRDGRINDAYALLRKYYDSGIINIYTHLYLEDNVSIQNFIVKQIDDWLHGKAKLPEYRVMSQYIRNAASVKPITDLLFKDERYKTIRKRCNDHTHYNFYRNVLLNDNRILLPARGKVLEQLAEDIRDVFILHLAYMFYAWDHYLMSIDHVTCLDCGITPEPDSQYWVAPFAQDIFDQTVKQYRPDIAAEIKQNTKMQLA